MITYNNNSNKYNNHTTNHTKNNGLTAWSPEPSFHSSFSSQDNNNNDD